MDVPMKPTTVRIDENLLARLDDLTAVVDRSRSWLINDALRQYVEHQQWMLDAIQAAVLDADGGVPTVPHDEVIAELETAIHKAGAGEN